MSAGEILFTVVGWFAIGMVVGAVLTWGRK